ncbi:thiazole synthase [Leptospira wolffii]|uniref:thiazole synthase n=1 Tax=Leptospira wolffii TaxID=409998 RepID=UPI00034BDFB2|nr:thiazole synthase [Leptospira wolffii]TGK60234.1 thiazole synthase [Leptospira wolffii]TGK72576.1 thiazole synthase [Leptospira wolffii]TGK76241.1 thiazole synthase [Leptospira wolffii]TGL30493.1 thiazole synthase [Leptospira wolffii]
MEAKNFQDPLIIGGRIFRSRLFLGTGKFPSGQSLADAIRLSETEVVTVALRRVDMESSEDDILSRIDRENILLLPNTSGARNAEEAVRLARLSRELGGGDWLKLEVTPDPVYLLPDPVETLKAAEILVKEGFHILPYINADPILCKHLEEVGCVTVMPLGSPIGTNQGIRTRANLEIIIEQSNIPVVVDAGLGQPSHAAEAMEMGADAVLVNTAIAIASDPGRIAYAFRLATEAGRISYKNGAGRKASPRTARASSPLTGFLEEETR